MHFKNMFVSVIIPTRNRKDLLKNNLESIFNQSYPINRYEIIVVDNSSIDGTAEMINVLQSKNPYTLRYYRKKDDGPGSSRNLGISKARGDIIAFIDDDCVADHEWIERGVAKMGERVGLVQGKTLPNPNQIRRTFSHTKEITAEDFNYQTCNIFYRKNSIDQVDGFSTEFIGPDRFGMPMWGGEDTDLAWRVKKGGWKSVFAENAIVYHHVFDSSPLMILKSLISYTHCRHLFSILPHLFKKHPEIRDTKLFYKYFFLSRNRALFTLFIVSVAAGILIHPLFFLPAFPYTVHLLTWSFYARPLRRYPYGIIVLIIYFLRDFIDFILLASGSIRHQSIVL
jgi:glycosyltransferase involved in cell wall biosynthesis